VDQLSLCIKHRALMSGRRLTSEQQFWQAIIDSTPALLQPGRRMLRSLSSVADGLSRYSCVCSTLCAFNNLLSPL
jgi:hypothetical protein